MVIFVADFEVDVVIGLGWVATTGRWAVVTSLPGSHVAAYPADKKNLVSDLPAIWRLFVRYFIQYRFAFQLVASHLLRRKIKKCEKFLFKSE